jgi:hypothetical protein
MEHPNCEKCQKKVNLDTGYVSVTDTIRDVKFYLCHLCTPGYISEICEKQEQINGME